MPERIKKYLKLRGRRLSLRLPVAPFPAATGCSQRAELLLLGHLGGVQLDADELGERLAMTTSLSSPPSPPSPPPSKGEDKKASGLV